jgi:hypothetical protein
MSRPRAVIGLKAKTARAIAVILSEPADRPQFVQREELKLSDDDYPATSQPYHDVMELPWSEGRIAVEPAVQAIQKLATSSLGRLIRNTEAAGFTVVAVAIVGSPDRRLERIGNPHIRAHAAEGALFRRVLETAAKANGREVQTFSGDPTAELKRSPGQIKKSLTELGRAAGPPWRSDQKAAAAAAWVALAKGE